MLECLRVALGCGTPKRAYLCPLRVLIAVPWIVPGMWHRVRLHTDKAVPTKDLIPWLCFF